MKNILAIFTTILLATSVSSFAGEGHDHGPGQVQPTRGGVLMKGHDFFLEALGTTKEIKFYPLRKENATSNVLKPISAKEVKISATYSIPRGKSAQKLAIEAKDNYFVATVVAKGAHRYQVDVNIEVGTEKEKFVYQIEPQE